MSALVWSVESAILGLWALVFSFYSTPFHAFIARSHAMIAGFTMALQLVSAARGLDTMGHAASEAFVCAVTALLLVYVASILDTANHARLFSMPYAGILPLDAILGVAWFCAAMVSATGMALSGAGGRRSALMFHRYGYHASVTLPSLLMLWLYNFDASNTDDPIHKGIKLVRNVSVTHALIFTVYACLWGWFVVAQFLGEGFLASGKPWPASWEDMSAGASAAYVAAAMLKFLGRGGCVLIPVSAAFCARTSAQIIMAWVLAGVAAAYAVDLLGNAERVFGMTPPVEESEYMSSRIEPNTMMMMSSAAPLTPPRPAVRHDPAAVLMPSEAHAAAPSLFTQSRPHHQWRRDKMV